MKIYILCKARCLRTGHWVSAGLALPWETIPLSPNNPLVPGPSRVSQTQPSRSGKYIHGVAVWVPNCPGIISTYSDLHGSLQRHGQRWEHCTGRKPQLPCNSTVLFPCFLSERTGRADSGLWVDGEAPEPGKQRPSCREAPPSPEPDPRWVLGLGLDCVFLETKTVVTAGNTLPRTLRESRSRLKCAVIHNSQ